MTIERVVCRADEIGEGEARSFEVEIGGESVAIAVCRAGGKLFAVANRCPHAGGPLALGKVVDGCATCPWHGARFDLKTGEARWGPTKEAVATYRVEASGDRIEVLVDG